jgi:hypothetical protein
VLFTVPRYLQKSPQVLLGSSALRSAPAAAEPRAARERRWAGTGRGGGLIAPAGVFAVLNVASTGSSS